MINRTMTDREFRHLSRGDLIDIIYEYQKQEEKYLAEIDELKKKLETQEIKIKNAGSIAEAVVELNNIFETAQKTADQYLRKVFGANEDAEVERRRIIEDAKLEANRIINAARYHNPNVLRYGPAERLAQKTGFEKNEKKKT